MKAKNLVFEYSNSVGVEQNKTDQIGKLKDNELIHENMKIGVDTPFGIATPYSLQQAPSEFQFYFFTFFFFYRNPFICHKMMFSVES